MPTHTLKGNNMPDEVPEILFVCIHNAGRSRMAEAWFNHLAGNRYRGVSAGTRPSDHPHPEVVEAMREVSIEIPNTPGQMLTFEMTEQAMLVIGMGCAVEEACPALRVPLEDWGLEDPKGRSAEDVRSIRDDIRGRVERLIESLDARSETALPPSP